MLTRPVAIVALCALGAGCAPMTAPAPLTEAGGDEGVVRGQSPGVVAPGGMTAGGAPWGLSYLAPGEESCSQPPYAEGGFVAPPMGYYPVPPQAAVVAPSAPEAGWLDVLPPEGGAISPDFGLPESPTVTDRTPNPIYVPSNNPELAWETLARTLTEYFPIQSEQRVERAGAVLTEGRFETPWQTGATVFEPWRNDSVGRFNRWQSTLQTLRRRATVRVIPAAGGYEIGVRVEKQLEDLNRPEQASAGAASLRNDASLPTDRLNPVDRVLGSTRWIDIGRDEPLEQEMLRRFRDRLAEAG